MPEVKKLRVRLIAEALPPEFRDGRPTAFGLQDKKQALHPGRPLGNESAAYELAVDLKGEPGAWRFGGPFAHGTPAEPFLYLSWKYEDGGEKPEWVRRQKIRLDAIPLERLGNSDGVFEAGVPPITQRCATVGVEWRLVPE